jgi:hypothetical protein
VLVGLLGRAVEIYDRGLAEVGESRTLENNRAYARSKL